MGKDASAHYRNVAAGYTEAIRNSDAKAFLGVLFIAIMMVTVLAYRDGYPWYLNAPVLVIPFLAIFFCLIFCVYPRFPKAGRQRFPVRPDLEPDDFLIALDEKGEAADLPMRCVMLSRILYWKTVTLRIAYWIALGIIVVGQILLAVNYIWPAGH
jgi:hypothetical protein